VYKELVIKCYANKYSEYFKWGVYAYDGKKTIEIGKGTSPTIKKAKKDSSIIYNQFSSNNTIEIRKPAISFISKFDRTIEDEMRDLKRIVLELADEKQKEFINRFNV
jgi:hypothetical protein